MARICATEALNSDEGDADGGEQFFDTIEDSQLHGIDVPIVQAEGPVFGGASHKKETATLSTSASEVQAWRQERPAPLLPSLRVNNADDDNDNNNNNNHNLNHNQNTKGRSAARRRSTDELTYIERRSSWLSQQEPVPAIPTRFLDEGAGRTSGRQQAPHLLCSLASPHLLYDTSRAPDGIGEATGNNNTCSGASRVAHHNDRTPPKAGAATHVAYTSNGDASTASSFAIDGHAPLRDNARSPHRGRERQRRARTAQSFSRIAPRSNEVALAALTAAMPRNMDDTTQKEDLFLEVAENNGWADSHVPRADRLPSRASWHGKRQSLPLDARAYTSMEDRRPRTSGGPTVTRPASRLSTLQTELGRTLDRQRGLRTQPESVASHNNNNNFDDTASVASYARSRRSTYYSLAPNSPISPTRAGERVKSPEQPVYGGRRSSLGATSRLKHSRNPPLVTKRQESEGDSPAESSEHKQSLPESASVDSQTAPSTVWDELDDLKSRIKKLELTGKLPSTSGAAVAGSSSQLERPRTATTAPTTIDSSPKSKRNQVADQQLIAEDAASPGVGGPAAADIHPFLHAALTKAKPLLNHALYRTLEATAADALQLAAATGSTGPNGTTFSAASIVNSVAVPDRQIRRKADTLCRNLTDLCLALCEARQELPTLVTSPVATLDMSSNITPSGRFSRASPGRPDPPDSAGGRPMSRLDARRTSILGLRVASSPGASVSPRRDTDDSSIMEQENTPSIAPSTEPRRFGRSSSRLSVAPRNPRYDEVSGDEDPTVRPVSRVSDFSFRSKQTLNTRDNASHAPQRSPSLRETLNNRRSAAPEGHRELTRVASMTSDSGGRRRWLRDSTPPVLEEESSEQEYQASLPSSQPRRRITSLGLKLGSRKTTDPSLRSTSLSQRSRQVLVD